MIAVAESLPREAQTLREQEFRRLQALILAETGIFLGAVKKPLHLWW